jgi:hypothetical protein
VGELSIKYSTKTYIIEGEEMITRKIPALFAIVLFLLLALAACGGTEPAAQQVEESVGEGGIVVSNVKANMTVPSDTGSFWMEIANNGSADDILEGAVVDGCNVIELHDMIMDGDTMVMRQVEGGKIPIPAGETVVLKKGGLHVMCIGKEAPLEKDSSIDIALQFANAGTVNVVGKVVEPGEMPMNMDHSEMEGGE